MKFPNPNASIYESTHPRNRDWILNDLTPIPRIEGKKLVADYMNGVSTFWLGNAKTGEKIPGTEQKSLSYFYECKHYDKENKQCGIYDDRPGLCSGFPWFGTSPDEDYNLKKSLPPECSYNEDIGKPVQFLGRKQ